MNDFQTTVRMLRHWHATVLERGPAAYPVIADYLEDYGDNDTARQASNALRLWYDHWMRSAEISGDTLKWLQRVNERYGPAKIAGTGYEIVNASRCLIWANEAVVREQVLVKTDELWNHPLRRLTIEAPFFGTVEHLLDYSPRYLLARVEHLKLDFTDLLSASEMSMLWLVQHMEAPKLVSLNIVPPARNDWVGTGTISVAMMKNPGLPRGVRLLWRGRDT